MSGKLRLRFGLERTRRAVGACGALRARALRPAVLLLFIAFFAVLGAQGAEARQPNVVVLLADDLGWADVGFHGGEIATPSIDRIAREGITLDRYYVAPLCSPTRAAMLTGRDPIVLGLAYDEIDPWDNAGLGAREVTLAELFEASDYQTGIVGKWHLGHAQEPQLPRAQGFERFFGHLLSDTNYHEHTRLDGHDLQRDGRSIDGKGEYLTRLEAREAVRFIRERDPSKPFFLYVPFTAPHGPMQAPRATLEKYAELPRAGHRRTYAAMVDELDRAVGEILAALDDAELAEDTIVFFASDGGGAEPFGGRNAPLRGTQGQTFEGGIRVVAALRWPDRITAGGNYEFMMTAMDLMPTLASAAGVTVPSRLDLDGVDLWTAITNGRKEERDAPVGFVSEGPLPGALHQALFEGRFKLVQIVEERATQMQVRNLLFDVEADPYEQEDLAVRHPAVVQRLQRLLAEWRQRQPSAGTRSTLAPPPGWVAPRDWAAAVVPSSLLQGER